MAKEVETQIEPTIIPAEVAKTEVVEVPVEQVSEPVDEVAAFDDALLDRAESLGMTEDQIEAFQTPEALEAAVKVMDRRIAEIGRAHANRLQPSNPVVVQSKRQEPTAPPKPAPALDDFDLESLKDSLDEDAFAALKKVTGHLQGKLEGVTNQLNEMLSITASRNQQESTAKFISALDNVIGSFPDEWKAQFGGKRIGDLKVQFQRDEAGNVTEVTGPDAEAFRNCDKLARELNALVVGYTETGLKVPPDAELGKRALSLAFGEQQTKKDRAALRARIAAKANGVSRKPTHRQASDDDGKRQPTDAEIAAKLDARIAEGRKRAAAK